MSEKLLRKAETISESYYRAVKQACDVCLKTKSHEENFSTSKIQSYVEFLLACIAASSDTESLAKADPKCLKGFKRFCEIVDIFIGPKSKLQQKPSNKVQSHMQKTFLFTIQENEIIVS